MEERIVPFEDYEGQFAPPEDPEEETKGPDMGTLGSSLDAEFNDVKNRRRSKEEDWLKNLRTFKGQYDPEVLARMDPGQSRIFVRLPKIKVRTVLAKIMDLLFPMSGQLNWGLKPSPVADLPPHVKNAVIQELIDQTGQEPQQIHPDNLRKAIQEKAALRCKRMAHEIQDQLSESPNRIGYQQHIKSTIKSSLVYGTGVFKGPLVRKEDRKRWTHTLRMDHDTKKEYSVWELRDEQTERYLPYFENVSIWDAYPDMTARTPDQMRYFWQTHLMTITDLRELKSANYFDEAVIDQYIRDYSEGDARMEQHEQQLRAMSEEDIPPDLENRYRAKERWGLITGRDLKLAGVDISEDLEHHEFWSNIWLLGDKVIKAVLAPVRGAEMPYYLYYYDKDESSIFADGMMDDIRDPQSAFNASVRKALDQYGKSGAMYGVNVSALAPGENPEDIYAEKVFKFASAEDMDKAMKVWIIPSYMGDGINMARFMQDYMDEVTAPRYMQGDGRVKGAGETASGLSMLMGALNVNLKDLIKNFDMQITQPFITGMFHWNMQFNPREDIKGDYAVEAKGSTALIAKEVKAQKLANASNFLENPRFEPRIKDDILLKELFESLDMPSELVRTDDEYQAYQQQKMAAEAEARAQAELKVLLDEMRSRGMEPEKALMHLLERAAPAIMQQQAQQGQGVQT